MVSPEHVVGQTIHELEEFESPDDIAEFFRDLGLIGYRSDAYGNPVTMFFAYQLAEYGLSNYDVFVDQDEIILCREHQVVANWPTPDSVAAFLKQFNEGAYEFLDAEVNREKTN
jgi:hypothetical protein